MFGRWKRVSLLTAAVALVAVIGAASFASAKVTKSGGGKTLDIYGFGAAGGDEIARTRAEIAERALGGARVDDPRGGFNDQQFLAMVASRSVPDLVYMGREKIGTYAAKGALVPLTSCVRSEGINLNQYRRAALAEVTYQRRLYAIPEFTNQRVIIVKDPVARRAGLQRTAIQTTN